MYQLVPTTQFKRRLKVFIRKHPELTSVMEQRLEALRRNPTNPKLVTHKLTGKLKGKLALSITYHYRLAFQIDGRLVYLLSIGTHDEVY